MNRNISIVVVLLVLVVIAGYLVWLRSRVVQPTVISPVEEQVVVTPTAVPTMAASPSATPGKEATASTKQKTSTSSSVKK